MGKSREKNPGRFKKGHHGFQTGLKIDRENDINPVPTVRLTQEVHNLVVMAPKSSPVQVTSSYRLLRPTPSATISKPSEESKTNRVVNIEKEETMWNDALRQHTRQNQGCQGNLVWDHDSEERRGLGCRVRLKCMQCTFISEKYSLYDGKRNTGQRGRDTVKINESLQVGLTQTRAGNAAFRLICMGANIPPPSERGMQKSSNRVCDKIEELNKGDMRKLRKTVRDVNTYRGNPAHRVDLQMDGTYNNPLYSGAGKTPHQPAAQSVFTAIETNTQDNFILDITTKNKQCSMYPPCQGEHKVNCKGNLPMGSSIGNEQAFCRETLESLKADGLEADKITTDSDTGAFKAAESMYQSGNSSTKPTHQLDPVLRTMRCGQHTHGQNQPSSRGFCSRDDSVESKHSKSRVGK